MRGQTRAFAGWLGEVPKEEDEEREEEEGEEEVQHGPVRPLLSR